jgi:hypothetical protein
VSSIEQTTISSIRAGDRADEADARRAFRGHLCVGMGIVIDIVWLVIGVPDVRPESGAESKQLFVNRHQLPLKLQSLQQAERRPS